MALKALKQCNIYAFAGGLGVRAMEHTEAMEAIKEALAQEQEPLTEWLVCPKCSYKSPYTPLKALTLAEDAERITKQARAALEQQEAEAHLQAVADFGQLQEQEPVAWMFQHEETGRTMCVDAQQVEWGFEKGNPRLQKIGPLYASPPKRQPLTDEEILKFGSAANISHDKTVCDVKFARAIEAAHGIKELNT
jgi:hypothetical protein